jgi:hypothetical protein
MKLVKKDKELRNIALTVKLTASERARLADLARHYETSNADLLVWLVEEQLNRVRTAEPAQPTADDAVVTKGPDTTAEELRSIRKTLEQLAAEVAELTRNSQQR